MHSRVAKARFQFSTFNFQLFPLSRVLIHQPLGGIQGQASDIERHAKEIIRMRNQLYKIYETHTGQSLKKIEADCDRDNFLTAEDAKEYKLVDEIVTPRKGS